jgi:hypothetical protein
MFAKKSVQPAHWPDYNTSLSCDLSAHAHARARETANFSRSFLRSGKISLQNGAILRHALQTALGIFPYEKHAMQHYENLRNSLGLN